ncbi:MAG: serine/threonine protein kinase [Labilithrix sp.]|nr:serine/threonine protein kinase [Labilithrix sp.]
MPSVRAPKAPLPPVAAGAAPRPAPPPVPASAPVLPSRPPSRPNEPVSVPPAAVVTADTDINVGASANAETRVGSLAAVHAVPTVGDRIGKYVVDRLIGSGGMGLVVAARHEALGELVAIKLLRPKAAGDKVHSERFSREARAIIKIKSEHVVRVLDAGTLDDSGAPYIVMEYLIGKDLAAILREEGPMYPSRAADLMLQVCEAVASAHAVGVVHRDLKPSNFFVTQRADGTTLVKVLDFGISKAIGQEGVVDPNLTETQAVFGSPTYMSPEQIRSAKHVDHRSDIWSLGVALYELLTGKLPFAADNVAGLLASIVADPPFFPRGFAPNLPQELEALLLACLQKDPKQRVQSVVELACRLAAFATPNVETHNLVERIQRLATKTSGQHVPSGATTTGPKLPQGTSHPDLAPLPPPPPGSTSRPMGMMPPPGWPPPAVPHDAHSSHGQFGSTGTDLSAEAPPPPSGRSVYAGIGIGLGVAALLVVGGVGVWLGTRQAGSSSSASTPPPETSSVASPATTEPPAPPPSSAAPPPSAIAAGAPVGAPASAKPSSPAAGRKGVRHGSKGASGGAPTVTRGSSDPTNDRF